MPELTLDISILQLFCWPFTIQQGDETLPRLANRSDRDTGFTNAMKPKPAFVHRVMTDAYEVAGDVPPAKLDRMRKQDPAEYLNMTNPHNYSRWSIWVPIKHAECHLELTYLSCFECRCCAIVNPLIFLIWTPKNCMYILRLSSVIVCPSVHTDHTDLHLT